MEKEKVRPIFKKLLIAAVVVYVVSLTVALSDIYRRVVILQDAMNHVTQPHTHQVTGIAR